MIGKIKQSLITNLKNIPGWSTNRKIVAFISDDWGDLRIHSESDYYKLIENDIPVDRSPHTKVETLATYDDLNRLFEVLSSVKDKNNRHAVISPFTIMANPDFDKIEESGFQKYHYKLFTDTLKDYEDGTKTIEAWRTGIRERLFIPELHGREHINVPLWMRKLQSGDEIYRTCFKYHFAHYSEREMKTPIVAACNFQNETDFSIINNSIEDSIRLFESVFNRSPSFFNPPNGIFHSVFYPTLLEGGIQNIDSSHFRLEPDAEGNLQKKRYKFGEISKGGMVHCISNCAFEPIKKNQNVVDETLTQVAAAFRWNKPAIINTHRVNFVKGRGGDHRENSLNALSKLLNRIISTWPDVEFMGMGEFGSYMNKTLKNKMPKGETSK